MDGQRLPGVVREHLRRILMGEPSLKAEELIGQDSDLAQHGACFVTLNVAGRLRGCIGSLVAHRPLAEDVLKNAEAAAFRDHRFPPLSQEELPAIQTEVSILTPPVVMAYNTTEELLHRLRPGIDGVILTLKGHRATFLPQVWESLPTAAIFLDHLCRKAGLNGDCYQHKPEIAIYTVDKYYEEQNKMGSNTKGGCT